MKILVIGGCHCYGYGVDAGQGFVQKLEALFNIEGHEVQIDYYTPIKMDKIVRLVKHLSWKLASYDLILLQIGHFELLNADSFKRIIQFKQRDFNFRVYGHLNESIENTLNPTNIQPFLEQGFDGCIYQEPPKTIHNFLAKYKGKFIDNTQVILLDLLNQMDEIPRLYEVRMNLIQILTAFTLHHDKILLLTPFPVKEKTTNFLRKKGSKIFLEEAQFRGVSVVDTHSILSQYAKDYLSSDDCHLNQEGHLAVYREIKKHPIFKKDNNHKLLKYNTLEEYILSNQN
jgi:hypothetical protein